MRVERKTTELGMLKDFFSLCFLVYLFFLMLVIFLSSMCFLFVVVSFDFGHKKTALMKKHQNGFIG